MLVSVSLPSLAHACVFPFVRNRERNLRAHYSKQRFLTGKGNNFVVAIGNNSVFSPIFNKTI